MNEASSIYKRTHTSLTIVYCIANTTALAFILPQTYLTQISRDVGNMYVSVGR